MIDKNANAAAQGKTDLPLQIGIVVNAFPVLSETFIFNKVRGLVERGHRVVVFTNADAGHQPYYQARGEWLISLERLRTVDKRAPIRSILATLGRLLGSPSASLRLLGVALRRFPVRRALVAWVKALPFAVRKLDVLHFEFSGIAATNLDVLPLLSCPVVVSCRGSAEQVTPLVQPARKEALGRVFAAASRVHCVSDDMVATAQRWGLDSRKAFVNRPAVDLRDFTRSSPPAASPVFRVVSVGRLHWDKGFAYALLGVAKARAAGVPLRYTIVGDGPDRTHLVYTADSLGISEFVDFKGPLGAGGVRETLETADVFLLPTVREGISNACLEAMALGVAVISTTTGGMKEVIEEGVSGRLVAPRDALAIASELERLYRGSEERVRLGKGARSRVEAEFAIPRQIAVFEREYGSLRSGGRETVEDFGFNGRRRR
ncbi:MAG TPA: glycosyltransferase family 4 protein [Gemmatimonadaceae bacterium]|nr:glycosyltransferase family 4 protein [Gemmatimonadaceae bacterium]